MFFLRYLIDRLGYRLMCTLIRAHPHSPRRRQVPLIAILLITSTAITLVMFVLWLSSWYDSSHWNTPAIQR